jgi:hypothetical protein
MLRPKLRVLLDVKELKNRVLMRRKPAVRV